MSDAPSPSSAETPQDSPSFLQKLRTNVVLIAIGSWALTGIAALIMSIVWFGFSGSISEKIVGLALAFLLGPLYFLFYGVNKNYCRSLGANVTCIVNRMIGGAAKATAIVADATAATADVASLASLATE